MERALGTRSVKRGCIMWCTEGPKAQFGVNLGPGLNSIYWIC